MRIGRSQAPKSTRVVVLTADAAFDASARATFGASSAIDLTMVPARTADQADILDIGDATVVVVEFEGSSVLR